MGDEEVYRAQAPARMAVRRESAYYAPAERGGLESE
jgi:hypothetical protein